VDVLEVEELPTETTLPLVLELLPVTVVTVSEDEDVEELPDAPPMTVTVLSPVPLAEELSLPAVVAVPDPLSDGVEALPDELPFPAVVAAPAPPVEVDASPPEELLLPVVVVALDEEPPITVTEEELSDWARAGGAPNSANPRISSAAISGRKNLRPA
jgi:hypothetical protein